MFKFNYSVGDIKNSDSGEGIVCLGREVVVRGEGSGGKGEEVGERGRDVGNAYPPVHPLTELPRFLFIYPRILPMPSRAFLAGHRP